MKKKGHSGASVWSRLAHDDDDSPNVGSLSCEWSLLQSMNLHGQIKVMGVSCYLGDRKSLTMLCPRQWLDCDVLNFDLASEDHVQGVTGCAGWNRDDLCKSERWDVMSFWVFASEAY